MTTKKVQKRWGTGAFRHIYQKEIYKECFQHDMAYGSFQDLHGGTVLEKVFNDNAHYSQYALVISFKDKKGKTITEAF